MVFQFFLILMRHTFIYFKTILLILILLISLVINIFIVLIFMTIHVND